MNRKQSGSWDMAHHPPMPRPKNDDGYFEEMSKMVFRAGLNWSVIEKKWPDIKRALANFSIDDVAQFDDSDIDRLLKDDGMIRSAKKITGVIANAQAMQQVQQEFMFLFGVGEEMPQTLQKMQEMHGSTHSTA